MFKRLVRTAFIINAIGAFLTLAFVVAVRAQTLTPGIPVIPMGNCYLSATQLGSAIGLSSCVRASFTASAGTNSTQLVVTSVTGYIRPGDQIISGTGITAGTIISSQVSGTTGGAGTYQLNATNTASSASATSGGIPTDAQGHIPSMVVLYAETAAIRWRDDGGAPTSSVGMEIVSSTNPPFTYVGTLTALQFIAASGSPVLDIAFYRTSSP
jgi:hypothetical protein